MKFKMLKQTITEKIKNYFYSKIKRLIHRDKMMYKDDNEFLKNTLTKDRIRKGDLLKSETIIK